MLFTVFASQAVAKPAPLGRALWAMLARKYKDIVLWFFCPMSLGHYCLMHGEVIAQPFFFFFFASVCLNTIKCRSDLQ